MAAGSPLLACPSHARAPRPGEARRGFARTGAGRRSDYLATIHRLQGLAIDILPTGHYLVARGDGVAEFLGESRAYVDRVDDALRQEQTRSGAAMTMRELVDAHGPRLGGWPAAASDYLVFPLHGRLERLLGHGAVTVNRRDGLVAWRAVG